jgi:hypothetical protein
VLHVQADGHPEATAVVSSDRTEATVRLMAGATLELAVHDAEGKPTVGAQVELRDAQDRPIVQRMTFDSAFSGRAATDSSGRLVRKGLPPGTVIVVITPVDGAPVRREVALAAGRANALEVELP